MVVVYDWEIHSIMTHIFKKWVHLISLANYYEYMNHANEFMFTKVKEELCLLRSHIKTVI